ncbi:MAG: ATP:cob(I)alamin adenosyltransferase [Elusimicrobia bacterium]|nr:ATP:cob(I)alamin adenosyltransferase [Elusimicrobiota bacterium]
MKRACTKKGDAGFTRDFSGRRLAKDDLRILAQGKFDALQSAIDLVLLDARRRDKAALQEVQKKLWQSAGELARASRACVPWPVTQDDVEALERHLAGLGATPRKFVRFDTLRAVHYNECRIRCRELESSCTRLLRAKKLRPEVYSYLNRLSSLFFMLACRASRAKS